MQEGQALEALVAHETAHQWLGNLVTMNSPAAMPTAAAEKP